MATTIQIKDETAEMLKQMKNQTKADSYDSLIKQLMTDKKKSLYGFLGKMTTKEILKDLRDKHDRF